MKSSHTIRALIAALALICGHEFGYAAAAPVLQLAPASEVALASHIAPYTCGVTSSKFARICRPSAQTSCNKAVERGVTGFSKQYCAAQHTACVSCLAALRQCISRIGHASRVNYSCDECTGKFSRCIGKRYPVQPH